MGQAVPDRLVVDERQQKQGVRFGQQLLVELSASAPRLGVVHVGRKLGHALAVAAMYGDPQRSDEVQVVDVTHPHPPHGRHRCHASSTACNAIGDRVQLVGVGDVVDRDDPAVGVQVHGERGDDPAASAEHDAGCSVDLGDFG